MHKQTKDKTNKNQVLTISVKRQSCTPMPCQLKKKTATNFLSHGIQRARAHLNERQNTTRWMWRHESARVEWNRHRWQSAKHNLSTNRIDFENHVKIVKSTHSMGSHKTIRLLWRNVEMSTIVYCLRSIQSDCALSMWICF